MQIKTYIRILFWVSFIIFVLNKFLFRPWISHNDLPGVFSILSYSLPNFIEAILGSIVLTAMAFQIRKYLNSKLKDTFIFLISISIAAIYVLSQELKYHNLGGNNVYDFNDLIASILGLSAMSGVFCFYGFMIEAQRNES